MKKIEKKQIVSVFFAFLVMGGGFLLLRDSFGTNEFNREAITLNTNSLLADEAQRDGDSDGLKDWEEGLWKTDPKNPDSDGDGTFDGEEVRNTRNPLKAGPDDEYKTLEESPLGDVIAQNEAEKDLTLTDIFARDFTTGYFALKQGGRYNDENRDKLIKTLMAGMNTASVKEYTINDLVLSQKSDIETIKKYGNALGKALKDFYRGLPTGELTILETAIKNDDKEGLSQLEEFAGTYKNVAQVIAKITVPLVLQSTHLELLNGYNGIGEALKGLQNVLDDPVGGAVYIKTHRENNGLVDTAFKDLKNYFSKSGIRFNKKEDGYIFQI